MATHSSVLAWRIPGMGEPGGLPSMGLHRVGHDWSDLAAAAAAPMTTVAKLMGKEKPGNWSTTYKWQNRLRLLSEWLGVWLQRLPGRRKWLTASWSVGDAVWWWERAQDGVRRWHALGHTSVSSGETSTFSNPVVSSHVNWKIQYLPPQRRSLWRLNVKL